MIKVGILTVSDKASAGKRKDLSGEEIRRLVKKINGKVLCYEISPDEKHLIKQHLRAMADKQKIDLILTTGGTGLAPRDLTPEATKEIVSKEVPGITEAIRTAGLRYTPHAMLSRAVAGVRKKALIINLPGSPRAVKESLSVILAALPHAVALIKGKVSECARK